MSTSTRDFVLEVIKTYKSHPCLWQVKLPDYHNREKKNAAMNVLLDLFKKKDPDANLDTVKRKINSMRSCFKKELNKVKKSSRSGAAEIHVPKLWYYSEMLFLADVNIPRASRSVNSILDDMPFEDYAEVSNDESEDSVSTNVQSPLSEISVASSSRHQSRKTKVQVDYILPKVAKKMDETNAPPAKLEYDSFGEHIAERLRKLPTMMATYCQKIINDAIFMAETNNLTIDSHIVQNRPQVFFSQPNLKRNSHDSIILNNASNQPGHSEIKQNTNILYDAAFVAPKDETPENSE